MNYSNILLALFLAVFAFSCEDKLDEGVLDQTTYYYINESGYPITLSVQGASANIPDNMIIDSSAAPGDTIRYHSMIITGVGSPFMSTTEANEAAITVTIRFKSIETKCLEFKGAISDPATDIRHYLAYNRVSSGSNACSNAYFTVTNELFNKSGVCK